MPVRRRRTPTQAVVAGRRRAQVALAALGAQIRDCRVRRNWTQADLARRIGVTQARQSQIEAGQGGGVPAHVWFAFAEVLELPLRFEFGRDRLAQPEDAGHLDIQEFMLGLGRKTGRARQFELPTKPDNPSLSVDVQLRDDSARVLIIEECWNTFGNIGASVRSTRRKLAEAQELAVAVGGETPYAVAACWVVRDLPRNRDLLARYPEIFKSTFTASSVLWVEALAEGSRPPPGLGLVWCDARKGRLMAWRK